MDPEVITKDKNLFLSLLWKLGFDFSSNKILIKKKMCNEKTLLIFLNKKLIFLKIFFLKENFNSFRGKENLIFLF